MALKDDPMYQALEQRVDELAAKVDKPWIKKIVEFDYTALAAAGVLILAIAGLLLLGKCSTASAGEYHQPKGGASQATAASGADASAESFADSHAVGGSVGDVAGGSTGAVTQQGGTMNNSTKSYAVGMSDLTTSDGLCPLLGSFSVFLVAGTYEVPVCRAAVDMAIMRGVGFDEEAVKVRACQVESIAEVTPWCNGKVIQR